MQFSLADFQYWPLLTRLGEMQLLVPAALIAIWRMHREADARPLAAWWLLALAVAVWLLVGMLSAPESPTHAMVTRLALSISGKDTPFTREGLLLKEFGRQ